MQMLPTGNWALWRSTCRAANLLMSAINKIQAEQSGAHLGANLGLSMDSLSLSLSLSGTRRRRKCVKLDAQLEVLREWNCERRQ